MIFEEAQAKIVRELGVAGRVGIQARPRHDIRFTDSRESETLFIVGDRDIKGTGDSWEAAFADMARRRGKG